MISSLCEVQKNLQRLDTIVDEGDGEKYTINRRTVPVSIVSKINKKGC